MAWIEPGDALLAIDRDGDGRIADGTELFGDAAAARDGFAALRSLDADADGAITVRDASFGRLLLWTDDGDARTEGGELSTLDGAGIVRIDLDALPSDRRDGSGSVMALWSTFVRTDGTAAAACDVFFAER